MLFSPLHGANCDPLTCSKQKHTTYTHPSKAMDNLHIHRAALCVSVCACVRARTDVAMMNPAGLSLHGLFRSMRWVARIFVRSDYISIAHRCFLLGGKRHGSCSACFSKQRCGEKRALWDISWQLESLAGCSTTSVQPVSTINDGTVRY